MQKYIVWYKTRSGNYSREIPFKSLERAKPLFNALERDDIILRVRYSGAEW